MAAEPRTRYLLTLECLPGDQEPFRRLRALLKIAKRTFGMICVAVDEIMPTKESADGQKKENQ